MIPQKPENALFRHPGGSRNPGFQKVIEPLDSGLHRSDDFLRDYQNRGFIFHFSWDLLFYGIGNYKN